jgi:hypothetical protein
MPIVVEGEHVDTTNDSAPITKTMNMHDGIDRRREEGVHRLSRDSREESERLDTCREIRGRIRVDRRPTALVTGVHRGKQVDDLGTPHLTEDDPVWTHSKGLPDEVTQCDCARALHVRHAGLESHHVRVSWGQFDGVFRDDNPFIDGHLTEQGVQDGRLPRSGSSRDNAGMPSTHK